jgi:hypothetical protein
MSSKGATFENWKDNGSIYSNNGGHVHLRAFSDYCEYRSLRRIMKIVSTEPDKKFTIVNVGAKITKRKLWHSIFADRPNCQVLHVTPDDNDKDRAHWMTMQRDVNAGNAFGLRVHAIKQGHFFLRGRVENLQLAGTRFSDGLIYHMHDCHYYFTPTIIEQMKRHDIETQFMISGMNFIGIPFQTRVCDEADLRIENSREGILHVKWSPDANNTYAHPLANIKLEGTAVNFTLDIMDQMKVNTAVTFFSTLTWDPKIVTYKNCQSLECAPNLSLGKIAHGNKVEESLQTLCHLNNFDYNTCARAIYKIRDKSFSEYVFEKFLVGDDLQNCTPQFIVKPVTFRQWLIQETTTMFGYPVDFLWGLGRESKPILVKAASMILAAALSRPDFSVNGKNRKIDCARWLSVLFILEILWRSRLNVVDYVLDRMALSITTSSIYLIVIFLVWESRINIWPRFVG